MGEKYTFINNQGQTVELDSSLTIAELVKMGMKNIRLESKDAPPEDNWWACDSKRKPKHSTSIHLGTDNGKFQVTYRNNQGNFVRKSFKVDALDIILAYCQKLAKRFNILSVMSSSSMDFPEEEGVTQKQVQALYEKLGCE